MAKTKADSEPKLTVHDSQTSGVEATALEADYAGSTAIRAPVDTPFPAAAATADSAAPEASALPKSSLEIWARSQPDDSFWTSDAKVDAQQVDPHPASSIPPDVTSAQAGTEAAKSGAAMPGFDDLQQQMSAGEEVAETSMEPQKLDLQIISSHADVPVSEANDQAMLPSAKLGQKSPGRPATSQTTLLSHGTGVKEDTAIRASDEDAASPSQAQQGLEDSTAQKVQEYLGESVTSMSRPAKVVSPTS